MQAKKGGLSQCCPEEMLGQVFKAVIAQSKVDPKLIQDVAVGNVLPPGEHKQPPFPSCQPAER